MNDNIEELLDNQRWLMNSGLFTTEAQNNLYIYGALIHRDIVSVEVSIDPDKKKVAYILFCRKRLLEAIEKYKAFRASGSILSLIRLRWLLRRHGNINLLALLSQCVKDYCGPSWTVTMDLREESEYHDDPRTGESDK